VRDASSAILNFHNYEDVAHQVQGRVWRTSLNEPGFLLIRFADAVDSHALRRSMVSLIESLPKEFTIERLGRFDQQVSSKFHRDGAPLESLLLLGYEPTPVRSRFWVADVSAAAHAEQLPLNEYLAKFNPMFPLGEGKLTHFITEVRLPHGESFILAINNSQLQFDPALGNPLGVLHKVIIDEPDPTARRVINSIGLTPDRNTVRKINPDVLRFLTRNDLD
jgi:hypothetical protein